MSDIQTTTGCTHAHGPIGKALGAFIGFCDGQTIAALEASLRDAASQEFDWWQATEDSKARAYHTARWREMTAAADYCALLSDPDEL
jgi:hypothetical protein